MSFVENLVDEVSDFFGGEEEQSQAPRTSFPDTIATATARPRQATAPSQEPAPVPGEKPQQTPPKPERKPQRDLGVSKFQGKGPNPGLRKSTKQAQPPGQRKARAGGGAQPRFGEDPKSGVTPLRAELEGRSATDIQRTLQALENADADSKVMGSELTVAKARDVLKQELKARQ